LRAEILPLLVNARSSLRSSSVSSTIYFFAIFLLPKYVSEEVYSPFSTGMNDFFVSWAKVQPEIAKTTRVCSYDRTGLGWSNGDPAHISQYGTGTWQLWNLLETAGVPGPYIMVGHSYGGINAICFDEEYDVVGVVLVDSAQENQGERVPFLKTSADRLIDRFRRLSIMSSFGLIALSPETIPNNGLPAEAYKQYQTVLATTRYFDGAIAETQAFYSADRSDDMIGCGIWPEMLNDIPLIILSHGLPDLSLGLTESEQAQFEQEWAKMQTELLCLSSNSKQIIAKKSGHYIQLDQPELVIEAILELVRKYQK
jgi:pimeloyl-ACP methyl ester carboxylesterase